MPVPESPIKLSIIVPCYKVERWLPRCLDSLMSQTLDEIEAVCINDGSPDACIDILRRYESRFPGKVIVIDKANEGVWRGRWDGIAAARGEYIGFLDPDDYAEPSFAEELWSTAKQADADIAVCGFHRVDQDDGRILTSELCEQRKGFSVVEEPGRLIELNTAPWNKAFRASVMRQMRDLPAPPPVLDDTLFHILFYLKARGRVAFCGKPLVNYMVRSGSIINSITEAQVDAIFAAFEATKGYYEQAKAPAALAQSFDAMAFLHLGVSLAFRLSGNPDCKLSAYLSRCTSFLDEHFGSWRNSPYINLGFTRAHGGPYAKLLIASWFYKLHLMRPFLACYRFAVSHGIDIKW